MNKPEYLFHYTSEARLNDIIKSGKLEISKAALSKKEKPTLWLSTDPDWDDSALKFLNYKNKDDQWKAIGLGRIVVPFLPNFITYAKWKHVSGVNSLLEKMESILFSQYDRSKWWASFKSIPVDEFLSIEYWDGEKWCCRGKRTPSVFNVNFSNNNLYGSGSTFERKVSQLYI
jgi:hypothetical protein